MDNKKITVESLIQRLMLEADAAHLTGRGVKSSGFVVFQENGEEPKTGCAFLYPSRSVRTLEALRRFSASVRTLVKSKSATCAGVVCDLPIALDSPPPVQSVVIYLDQQFSGMRVYIAPQLPGDHLVFRDLGVAHPSTNFFPPLFGADFYGPALTEA